MKDGHIRQQYQTATVVTVQMIQAGCERCHGPGSEHLELDTALHVFNSLAFPGCLDSVPLPAKNVRVIRKLAAAVLCIALQVMAFDLPLIHAHLDDHDTSHHAPRTIHAHFAAHDHGPIPNGPSWSADDHDRALSISALVMRASSAPVMAAVMPSAALPSPPPVIWHPLALDRTHGHDPPWIASLAARAPPSLLS